MINIIAPGVAFLCVLGVSTGAYAVAQYAHGVEGVSTVDQTVLRHHRVWKEAAHRAFDRGNMTGAEQLFRSILEEIDLRADLEVIPFLQQKLAERGLPNDIYAKYFYENTIKWAIVLAENRGQEQATISRRFLLLFPEEF